MNKEKRFEMELLYERRSKKKWVALLLNVVFGPLGFIYTSSWGALVGSFILLMIASIATSPLLLIGEILIVVVLWIVYLGCLFWWASNEVDEFNKKVRKELEDQFND